MSDWQPIETAPRDGTAVDLWGNGRRWSDCEFEDGDWWHGDTALNAGVLTHWMPPPKPPVQS